MMGSVNKPVMRKKFSTSTLLNCQVGHPWYIWVKVGSSPTTPHFVDPENGSASWI
ncbi:hypothetical protein PanWU01x14_200150 [Parasponia andersonii]|uniref:Uncharacterized protein n=1 Tax=Parasponia andersonii TaxID=3476 RepID=A0A2P5BYG7_PARAD|nr:hypothetical protein PanWU01x14_200150 [Parasponia andersonii]